MDAIITAGGIPKPGDPLYEYTQGQNKALLDLAGKPMIQWVVDALSKSKEIEKIVVVGLDGKDDLTCSKPITFLPNQGNMLENIIAGTHKVIELNQKTEHVLSVSSDIPAITGEMVDWMVNEVNKTDRDVYYNVIKRETMDARFPGSKRSFIRFKDMEVCGGDMTVFRASLVKTKETVWDDLIQARKNVFKQAALIGYDTLILLLLRRLTLADAVARACKSLNLTGKALVCPFAEIGMDVDKPFQMDLLHTDLAQRSAI